MTYIADLTPWRGFEGDPNAVTIGWLHPSHPFSQGDTPEEFRRKLAVLCKFPWPRYTTIGHHVCEFCGGYRGNGLFLVKGTDRIYSAPTMIGHYVTAHQYRPPQEFVEAVLSASVPAWSGTKEWILETLGRPPPDE